MNVNLKEKSFDRKSKTQELIKEHEFKFDILKVKDPLFIPKCVYKPYSGAELHIAFFPSEIGREVDIYTEFTSISLEPEDPTRTLYKWNYNPFYKEEYETTVPNEKGDVRYLIPVSELVKIEMGIENVETTALEDFADLMDPDLDAPLSSMTVRDIAAILLKKPVSNKKWLNDLIK